MSRFTTSFACSWMYCRRGSTASPMRIENRASAVAASSIVTCFNRRRAGSIVVSQTLVPLVRDAFVAEFLRQVLPLSLRVGVVEFLAFLDLVQGRLRDVHEPAIEERSHVSEEQRQEERRDVLPIDVRVGHRDDLVVSDLLRIELFGDASANRGDERADLLVFQHLIEPGLFDVQDFPAEREDRLELAATTLLRGSAGGRPFDDEQLRLRRIALLAIRELSGEVEPFEETFSACELAGLSCGLARLGCEDRFPDADFCDLRSL